MSVLRVGKVLAPGDQDMVERYRALGEEPDEANG